ncbi:MAG: mandelate racemase/muconate lactonizing enzyme family protein [Dehalococcoidia bacterium]|nr:mandelate racemase/muconate lactonizing enzyme family protein [Dehalococcoidia bacterium]MDW8119057.1 mandelate racemase/muconate lactonizing enzyme family protein [Chloroflexota bacterium]
MKVAQVKTFLVHPGRGKNLLFVKVETDAEIYGWGEAYTQSDRDKTIEQHIQAMARYLVGRSPFHIKHFTQVMFMDYATRRGSLEFYCALSALEQAMWDIVGKAVGQPVYNLLGGPCRDRVRVYANGWYEGAKTPEDYARAAVATVRLGFTALKFDPFPPPWRPYISQREEDMAVETVRAVREAVGPQVDLLIEVHRRLAPMHAIRVARRLEEFQPFWYEEPVDSENLDALAEVRRHISLPVVTGEALYSKWDFREVLEKRCADIINPDVCNCGGILELKEIAAMAEPNFVVVSPHNYNSTTVGLAATLHVAAVIPNFLITEYFVNFTEVGEAIARVPLRVESSYIRLPTTPGLGIDLNEEALTRYGYKPFPARPIRHYHQEGP